MAAAHGPDENAEGSKEGKMNRWVVVGIGLLCFAASVFAETKYVDVKGTNKGKGFAGTMKRHGFREFPSSHGTERKHRAPGSLASFASDAGHGGNVKKGKKMAGHMGHHRVTSKNHGLVAVVEEKNLLVVKGSVPGPADGYVVVRGAKKA